MTQRDITIKRLIHEFGPVTIDHLIALAGKEDIGSPQTLWRRLKLDQPLLQDGVYLKKRTRSEKYVYATFDIRKRKGFDHDLMVTSILITLYLHFDLQTWQRPKEKFHGRLNEDLYAVLGLPSGQVHYFIEADTGSEGYAQIQDKVRRYLRHYEDKREGFIVLFVTQDERRVKDLCRRLEGTIPRGKRRMFLFTSIDQITAEPQGEICRLSHDTTFYGILPRLTQEPR